MGVCFWANMLHIQFLWLFSRQLILPAGLKNKKASTHFKTVLQDEVTGAYSHGHEVTLGRTPGE